MKKTYMIAASLLLAVSAVQADGTIVSLDLQSVYSGRVGSQSTGGIDEVWKSGYGATDAAINGSGDCLTCSDFDVTASLAAGEDVANAGQSTSDESGVQTSTVGEGTASAGTALKVGDKYSRGAIGAADYVTTTAGKFVGDSGKVESNQIGSAGTVVTMDYSGTACPSGSCGGSDAITTTTMSGYVNTLSSTTAHAMGKGGAGALAVNAGLQATKLQLSSGQLAQPASK